MTDQGTDRTDTGVMDVLPVLPAKAPVASGRRALLVVAAAGGLLVSIPLLRRQRDETAAGLDISIHSSPRRLENLRFSGSNGIGASLKDFHGKVVVLNVWATWCPPCREEMPTLDRLQAELGGTEFEVVALSIDRGGLPVVMDYMAASNLNHLKPYLDSAGDASSTLAVGGVPLTLVIDRQGREIARKLGPTTWDSPQMKQFMRGLMTNTNT